MALDIKGFVTPEQGFEGLYKIGEEAGKQKKVAAEATAKNKKTMQSTLKFMMDPKDYYTGTMFDPEINQKFYNAAQKAYDFIEQNPNATDVQLQTYILPNIKELNDYANIAKFSKSNLDEAIKNVPSGYDKQKIYQLAQDRIFKNQDGSTRDIGSVKQEMQTTGYDPIKQVIQENPDLVTTSEGIDEWLKSQERKKSTQSIETGARGEGGGTVKKFDLSIDAPSWAIPETDAKGELVIDKKTGMGRMIPEYDVAMDGSKQITHDGQPVKLLKDIHFDNILSKDPATADWVRGQVKKHISEYKDAEGNPIPIDSPQAELVAKNVLWEELNRRNVGNFEKSESKVTSTRAPKEGGGGYDPTGGGKTTGVLFDEIKEQPIWGADRTKPKAIIKQGAVTNADGTPYSGKFQIAYQDLPGNMTAVLKAGGIELPSGTEAYTLNVDNGVIQSMETQEGTISREDMVRSQSVYDAKAGKGRGIGWGAPTKRGSTMIESVKGAYKNVSGALKKMMPKGNQTKAKPEEKKKLWE